MRVKDKKGIEMAHFLEISDDLYPRIASYLLNSGFFSFSLTNKKISQTLSDLLPEDIRRIISQVKFIFKDDGLFVSNLEIVYALGANKNGVLGIGHANPSRNWVKIAGIRGLIKEVVVSNDNAAIITLKGKLYLSGSQESFQFALQARETAQQHVFNLIETEEPIESIAFGDKFIILLTKSGKILASGQLGLLGEFSKSHTKIPLPEPAKKILVNDNSVLAISITGQIYVWGSNSNKKLGLTKLNAQRPTLIKIVTLAKEALMARDNTLILTEKGELYRTGTFWEKNVANQFPGFEKIETNEFFSQIFPNGHSYLAITQTNKIYQVSSKLKLVKAMDKEIKQVIYAKSLKKYFIHTAKQELFSLSSKGELELAYENIAQLFYKDSGWGETIIIVDCAAKVSVFNTNFSNQLGRNSSFNEVHIPMGLFGPLDMVKASKPNFAKASTDTQLPRLEF